LSKELQQLYTDIKLCQACPFFKEREQPTISRGDPASPLIVLGENPSNSDHKNNEAFTGNSGKAFDKLLQHAEIDPEKVYFTNIMKCYGGQKNYFPEDNTPGKCFPFFKQQFNIIKPLAVILAGENALLWGLLRGSTEKVGKFQDKIGKVYRRKQIYDSTRFLVAPRQQDLQKLNDEDKQKLIQSLVEIKTFIKARQQGLVSVSDVIDIYEKPPDPGKQLEIFKWKKPTKPA